MKKPKLLLNFPEKYRGVIGNYFLDYLRQKEKVQGWKTSVEDFLFFITKENKNLYTEHSDFFIQELTEEKFDLIQEGLDYYTWWEKLPADEKKQRKTRQSQFFLARKMDSEPPTEKQIAWLKHYGCEIPSTKLQATKILDEIWKK